MTASQNSTREAGKELINKLWSEILRINQLFQRQTICKRPKRLRRDLTVNEVHNIKEVMVLAAHRLTFLEMVVTGLSYKEQRDARDYAKFVESKTKLEDIDFNELRELLR